jgi:predicted transcriptional regulator
MKPRIGVYLSEQMAARLAAAAKRPGATKSALVEAALAQFLASDDETDNIPVDRRLSHMSRQLEELDRGLRIVNETVALQARFHLAVTPVLPAADQRTACELGSGRFDELAAQVGRRVRLGTSLMQETMDRLSTPKREVRSSVPFEGMSQTCSSTREPDLCTSNPVGIEVEHSTAVREGGSLFNFPGKAGLPLH